MRILTALTALLVCAGAWAQDAGEPAEAVKVLGFTLDVPVPPGALPESAEPVAWTDDGAYTVYVAEHPWCDLFLAVSHRDHGVFYVQCRHGGDRDWERRLRMRHGEPAYKSATDDHYRIFLPDQFAFVSNDDDSAHWLSQRGPVGFDRPKRPKQTNDCITIMTYADAAHDAKQEFDAYLECVNYGTRLMGGIIAAQEKVWSIVSKAKDQGVAREIEGDDF